MTDALDQKLIDAFAGKVVRKDLVRKVKVGANVPIFVLEYLLGKYCATDNAAAIDAGLRVVNNTLAENFVRPEEVNKAQVRVKEKERHTFIDKVKVRYLAEEDKYWGECVSFGHKYIHVPEKSVREFDRLVMGGIWAEIEIRHRYDEEAKGKRSPFGIERLTPIQLALELALEGRRRVKEQLKKMGAFEFHQTSFSYRDNDTTEERYVGVPEEGGRELISTDPLAPGSVYAASVNPGGKVGLYRIEVGVSTGAGKLKHAVGADGALREAIGRAFGFLQGHKVPMGIAGTFDTTDFHIEAIDLLANRISCEAGIAVVVAIASAIKKTSVPPGLVILGDLSIQGNIKAVHSLVEPLQVAMENGAKRPLIPLENKRNFLEVSGEIAEKVDPVFYSDPQTAVLKALGLV